EMSFYKDEDLYRMTGIITTSSDNFSGRLILPNGNESAFSAEKIGNPEESKKETEKEKTSPEIVPVTFPNLAYGNVVKPKAQTVLFKNATVWTGENEGILEETDVLIQNGKIAQIGKNINASGAKIIDATGKYLTAGIIDEHSHLALSSVN